MWEDEAANGLLLNGGGGAKFGTCDGCVEVVLKLADETLLPF